MSMEIILTPEEERVREVLIEVAKEQGRRTISCTSLCHNAGLKLDMSKPCDRGIIGNILGRISHYENQCSRPMLSAIVAGRNQSTPSGGFLITAKELGLNIKDKDKCWCDELNRVYDYWQKKK